MYTYFKIFSVALPSALLEGRYLCVPYKLCLWPYIVETVGHFLLYCLYCKDTHSDCIKIIVNSFSGRSDTFYTSLLLSDAARGTIINVANSLLQHV